MRNRAIFAGIFSLVIVVTYLFVSTGQSPRDSASANLAPSIVNLLAETPTIAAAVATPISRSRATPGAGPIERATPRLLGNGGLGQDPRKLVAILPPVAEIDDPALEEVITKDLQFQSGTYAVGVKSLTTGQTALVNENQVFDQASLFKLSVMVESFKKRGIASLSFAETLTVTEKAAAYDLGIYRHEIGEPITITKAIEEMITLSDNVYANVLLDRVQSRDVNSTMRSLGMENTVISQDGLSTSLKDVVLFFDLLATGQMMDRQSSLEMIDILLEQQINNQIPLLLPEGIQVAHKTGNLEGLRHDAGIVYSPSGAYIIVVLSQNIPDGEIGEKAIARISKDVYDYFDSP